jgi:hypothetical protein
VRVGDWDCWASAIPPAAAAMPALKIPRREGGVSFVAIVQQTTRKREQAHLNKRAGHVDTREN